MKETNSLLAIAPSELGAIRHKQHFVYCAGIFVFQHSLLNNLQGCVLSLTGYFVETPQDEDCIEVFLEQVGGRL
jgi:hypothetical protein